MIIRNALFVPIVVEASAKKKPTAATGAVSKPQSDIVATVLGVEAALQQGKPTPFAVKDDTVTSILNGVRDAATNAECQVFKTSIGSVTLSASELQTCREVGARPEDYAEIKAKRARGRKTS